MTINNIKHSIWNLLFTSIVLMFSIIGLFVIIDSGNIIWIILYSLLFLVFLFYFVPFLVSFLIARRLPLLLQ